MFLIKTVEEIYNYKSDPEVLEFIEKFMKHSAKTGEEQEVLRHTFRVGYCYHFAKMLEATFERGKVCWAAPYSHIAWVDDNGCPYDIEGVCPSEVVYYIPVQYIGAHLQGFKHVQEDGICTSWDDIVRLIRDYERANNLPEASLDGYKR